jgi:hypothetical protein
LWEGLPAVRSTWEDAGDVSKNFDPAEYYERLPDYTAVPDILLQRLLEAADGGAATLLTPLTLTSDILHSLDHVSSSPYPCPSVDSQSNSYCSFWKAYLPTKYLAAGITTRRLGILHQRFSNGLLPVSGRDRLDRELACLLGHELLTDAPITYFAQGLTAHSVLQSAGLPGVYYFDSYCTQEGWTESFENPVLGSSLTRQEQIKPGCREAKFICLLCHVHGNHWILVVYGMLVRVWLVLDSLALRESRYTTVIGRCRRAVQYFSGVLVPNNLPVVVPHEWPHQVDGYNCGVFCSLAIAFIVQNSGDGGLVDVMMRENRVDLPSLPTRYIEQYREELFVFCYQVHSRAHVKVQIVL